MRHSSGVSAAATGLPIIPTSNVLDGETNLVWSVISDPFAERGLLFDDLVGVAAGAQPYQLLCDDPR